MAWIEIGLIFIALLVLYQRFSIPGLIAFVAFVAAIGGFVWLQYYWEQSAEDRVVLAFRYDVQGCPQGKPIAATITNNSARTVTSVFFDLSLKRRGFSNESGRLSSIRSDKILKPGEGFSGCYPMPSLRETVDPQEIEFEVAYKVVKFEG
ncbi:MAG: hypothetical protein ACJ8AS_08165 [Hyphomicrobiales bacterium]